MSKKLYEVKYEISGGLYFYGEAVDAKFRQACLNDVSTPDLTFMATEVTERPDNYNFGWDGKEYPYGENFSSTKSTLDHIVCEMFPVVPSNTTSRKNEEIITILGKKYKLTPID